MRHLNYLPIWRDANLLMLELEQAVRGFPRYHKYTVGSEIRATVLRVCQTIHRAHSRRQSRVQLLQQLVELVDDLKMQLQLARELKAFQNYRQFQRVAELAVGLGKQSGGWLKQARAEAGRPKGARPARPDFTVRPLPPPLPGGDATPGRLPLSDAGRERK
jgi:hypothetical protein